VRVCLSVCLLCAYYYVCLSARKHISGTTRPSFNKFLCNRPWPWLRLLLGGVAILDVLPLLWVTSYLHIVDHMEARRCRCSE